MSCSKYLTHGHSSTLSFAGPLLPSAQIMRVELFEHAGRGTVGENVRNLAKLPAILLPAHVHAAANQAVITPASGSRCHGSVAFQQALLPPTPVDLHVHAVAFLERDSAASNALAEL